MKLILASASPRRAELLHAAGIDFDVMPADVDETMDAEEWPDGYVRRIAQTKAEVVRALADGRPVLAADTIVIIDGQVLGKPADANDARRMLRLLAGREHIVMTAVHLACGASPSASAKASADRRSAEREGWSGSPGAPDAGAPTALARWGGVARPTSETRVERTVVEFAPLTDAEIDWYVASGEPMDKAGAYAIQGLASRFTLRIDGSYSNVVGLPVAVVYQLCTNAGLLIS